MVYIYAHSAAADLQSYRLIRTPYVFVCASTYTHYMPTDTDIKHSPQEDLFKKPYGADAQVDILKSQRLSLHIHPHPLYSKYRAGDVGSVLK